MLFQADQRFVWNGNLLRELAAQPEVTHEPVAPLFCHCFLLNAFNYNYCHYFPIAS